MYWRCFFKYCPGDHLAFFAKSVHCWLMISFLCARTLRASLPSCFPASQPPFLPHSAGACDYFSVSTRLCIFLISWCLYLPISPASGVPLNGKFVYQQLLPIFYHPQTCWGCTQLSRSKTTVPNISKQNSLVSYLRPVPPLFCFQDLAIKCAQIARAVGISHF